MVRRAQPAANGDLKQMPAPKGVGIFIDRSKTSESGLVHIIHIATGGHGRAFFLLFRLVADHGFGGKHQAGH